MLHLEIDRADIRTCRVVDDPGADGHVVMRIDHFALTANNVSYALAGDMLDYWGFFPAAAGWGRLPVMGFATVVSSEVEEVPEGSRYFGFYPAGSGHNVSARPGRGGFVDGAAHRDGHASAYRTFDLADPVATPDDEHRTALLRGLFVTSYLCADFLADNAFFDADQVVVTSASSKTSLALAHELRRIGGRHVVALTSPRNTEFVDTTTLYDEVIHYDAANDLDTASRTVIVDMAGDAALLGRLHDRLGNALAHSCRVGATHWEQSAGPAPTTGPSPTFFFAPTQLAKRSAELGREAFQSELGSALAEFLRDSRRWLTVAHGHGPDAMVAVYENLVAGRVPPNVGHVLTIGSET